MRLVSETRGIEKLLEIRSEFAAEIRGSYEHKAKPCALCESPGICCRDEHFVNVRITRLEAAAIQRRLDELGEDKRNEVRKRALEAIDKYDLAAPGDSLLKTYACPLFEKGLGCLVHDTAKPVPCIVHACYDKPSHLPPDSLQTEAEAAIDRLNTMTYGSSQPLLPLPVAVR